MFLVSNAHTILIFICYIISHETPENIDLVSSFGYLYTSIRRCHFSYMTGVQGKAIQQISARQEETDISQIHKKVTGRRSNESGLHYPTDARIWVILFWVAHITARKKENIIWGEDNKIRSIRKLTWAPLAFFMVITSKGNIIYTLLGTVPVDLES